MDPSQNRPRASREPHRPARWSERVPRPRGTLRGAGPAHWPARAARLRPGPLGRSVGRTRSVARTRGARRRSRPRRRRQARRPSRPRRTARARLGHDGSRDDARRRRGHVLGRRDGGPCRDGVRRRRWCGRLGAECDLRNAGASGVAVPLTDDVGAAEAGAATGAGSTAVEGAGAGAAAAGSGADAAARAGRSRWIDVAVGWAATRMPRWTCASRVTASSLSPTRPTTSLPQPRRCGRRRPHRAGGA